MSQITHTPSRDYATMTEGDAHQIKGVVEAAENDMRRDEIYVGGDGVADSATRGGQGKPAQNVFPAKYFSRKDDEKKVRLLQEYTASLNSEGRLPTIYAPTENDMNVLMRKDAEKELVNFEGFLQDYFDVDNPIHQKLLFDLYPNYFYRRWEAVEQKLKIQEKIAHLKLFGPQKTEDVMFMYALHNGDIEIPTSVVFDTTQNSKQNQDHFNRGFLNVHHWTSAPQHAGRVGVKPYFTNKDLRDPTAGSSDISALLTHAAARKGAGQEKVKSVGGQYKSVFGDRN